MKKKLSDKLNQIFTPNIINAKGGGFISGLVGWFIRIVIYDICITTIQEVLGVSRFAALFIFLGILAALSFVGYFLKQRMSPGIDE